MALHVYKLTTLHVARAGSALKVLELELKGLIEQKADQQSIASLLAQQTCSNGLKYDPTTNSCSPQIIQLGPANSSVACNQSTLGLLKTDGEEVVFCDGKRWVSFAFAVPGSDQNNPADDCKQVRTLGGLSGYHWVKYAPCILSPLLLRGSWVAIQTIQRSRRPDLLRFQIGDGSIRSGRTWKC